MLKVLTSHKGRTKRLAISEAVHSKTLAWIDADAPTAAELAQLSKLFGISTGDLDDIMDPQERSRVEDDKTYKLIILRSAFKRGHEIGTTPVGIIVTRNNILTIHKKRIAAIHELHNNHEILHHGVQYFVFHLIDKMMSNYFKMVEKIDGEIDDVEAKVFEHGGKSTAMHIFRLKKTLTFFQRSLLANRETMSQLIKMNVLHLTNKDLINFEDILHDISQLIDMTNTHKEILTGALEIHASTISNQMNDIIKKLTVLASFVLIPTMIASIYGMNFGQPVTGTSVWNMPELSWAYGYPFALGTMLISCVLLFTWFKRKKWL
ncbi:magnesium/cobalt transporter CorA [Candidatus Woesearchaeota archaeon]|jgi:magnesium transporter|nr:magnesium/cobalt transporter CorA [Candidatus Woesearchaeota archaeon]MBT4248375.1 magnesium/cobalt transporter CorA [Candidatus Woesearchaeota archaeon]